MLRAGLQMLTVVDPSGRRAGGRRGRGAGAGAGEPGAGDRCILPARCTLPGLLLLGGCQLAFARTVFCWRDDESARRLLRTSLVYLPALLVIVDACAAGLDSSNSGITWTHTTARSRHASRTSDA